MHNPYDNNNENRTFALNHPAIDARRTRATRVSVGFAAARIRAMRSLALTRLTSHEPHSMGVFCRRLIRAVTFRFCRERKRKRKKKKRERRGVQLSTGHRLRVQYRRGFWGIQDDGSSVSRVMRRGVTAVTTIVVASACAQKKRLTPYLADAAAAEEMPPSSAATDPRKNRPSRIYCE